MRIGSIFGWGPPAAGAVMILMAQTPRKDAVSNISTYFDWASGGPPAFLTSIRADVWATWIGVSLLGIGIVLWWFGRASPRTLLAVKNTELGEATPRAPTWVTLHEALRYIVYQSQWAEAQPAPRDKGDFDHRVSGAIREYLARGALAARGKSGLSESSLARATEPIPPDFWINAYIQPHGEITLASPDRGLATQIGSATPCYRSIVVMHEQLEQLFPRRAKADNAMTALAKFVEPLRAEIAAEKLDE